MAPVILILKTAISSPIEVENILKTPDNSNFLTSKAKLTFLQLRQAFTKILILYHFDREHYIQIETDVSSYVIGRILSQLTPESGQ